MRFSCRTARAYLSSSTTPVSPSCQLQRPVRRQRVSASTESQTVAGTATEPLSTREAEKYQPRASEAVEEVSDLDRAPDGPPTTIQREAPEVSRRAPGRDRQPEQPEPCEGRRAVTDLSTCGHWKDRANEHPSKSAKSRRAQPPHARAATRPQSWPRADQPPRVSDRNPPSQRRTYNNIEFKVAVSVRLTVLRFTCRTAQEYRSTSTTPLSPSCQVQTPVSLHPPQPAVQVHDDLSPTTAARSSFLA